MIDRHCCQLPALRRPCDRLRLFHRRVAAAVLWTAAALAATAQGPDVPVSTATSDQNETSIAYDPTDPMKLLAAWNDQRSGTWQVGLGRSTDGGATWNDGIIAVPGGITYGDPVVVCDANGVFFAGYIDSPSTFGIRVTRSTDGGQTFQLPVLVSSGDKPWLAVDTSPASPHLDNLYASWTNYPGTSVSTCRSTDGGLTFQAPVFIAPSGIAVSLAVGRTGDLHEVWAVWSSGLVTEIQYTRSTDGGVTFAPLSQVTTVVPTPGFISPGGFRAYSFPVLAADTSAYSDNLYVVWPDRQGGDEDIWLTRSTDGGVTWSPRARVNDDATTRTQIFPWISVDQTGTVYVTWLDFRNDPANLLAEAFYTYSTDGGVTFAPNVLLSDVPFDSTTGFLGDYVGSIATPLGLGMVWPDQRTMASTSTDVYFDAAPLVPTGTGCRINSPTSGTLTADISVDASLYSGAGAMLSAQLDCSTDGGSSWFQATMAPVSPSPNPVAGLAAGPLDFLWDSVADGVGAIVIQTVTLRVSVSDGMTVGTCTSTIDVDNTPPPPSCTLMAPSGLQMGHVSILVDATSASAPAVDLLLEWSDDGGVTFQTALVSTASPTPNPATAVPTGASVFEWDSRGDGVARMAIATGVILRASVDDGVSIVISTCDSLVDLDNTALCPGGCGDCDRNGSSPAVLDALVAAQIAAGLVVPTPDQLGCCDVDSSGAVTVLDALLVAQVAAGLPVLLVCP